MQRRGHRSSTYLGNTFRLITEQILHIPLLISGISGLMRFSVTTEQYHYSDPGLIVVRHTLPGHYVPISNVTNLSRGTVSGAMVSKRPLYSNGS